MPYPPEDAPALVKAARDDVGLTQAQLAAAAGTTQSVISAVESGRRAVSVDLLGRLLRAARMRPSIPLARYADRLGDAAQANHLHNLRVFGSVTRGFDTELSDVDLLVSRDDSTTLFDLAGFQQDAEAILGVTVDVILDDDREHPVVAKALTQAVRM